MTNRSSFPERLADILGSDRIRVVDVGARGGWAPKWKPFRPWLTMIGFEPEAAEFERLEASVLDHEVIHSAALSHSQGEVLLHVTRNPYCSSLYPPNQSLVQRLRPGDKRMEVVETQSLQATTLDRVLAEIDMPSVDFIKLDTQGSELDILRGSEISLGRGVIGVEVEVQFLPLYQGAALFSEVHAFLSGWGFQLMGFPNICGTGDFRSALDPSEGGTPLFSRWREALRAPLGRFRGERQFLYGDAVYFRPTAWLGGSTIEHEEERALWLSKATILACAVGYYEHALHCVDVGVRSAWINPGHARSLRGIVDEVSTMPTNIRRDILRTGRKGVRKALGLRL